MPEPQPNRESEEEFTLHYQRVAPALCAWVFRHLNQTLRARVEADDVLQEIWLRAFAIRTRFSGDDVAFRKWLFTVGKKVLYEVQRSTRRMQWLQPGSGATSQVDALDEVAASITRLTRKLVREEAILRFVNHVKALPREDQDLVSYCGLEGTTCAEAARLLGISAEAAFKRWQRLRVRLREEGLAHDWVA